MLNSLSFGYSARAEPQKAQEPVGENCSGILELDPQSPGPSSGEHLEYELTFGGAYMGKLELSVGSPRRVEGVVGVPLLGRIRTNTFISAVKPVEGRYMAIVDPGSLTPIGVQVESTIGEDPGWERVRFFEDGRRVETRYLYKGRERQRAYGGEHPLLEGLSLLHIARRVPLKKGLSGCQDILSTRRLWRVRAQVVGSESVDTPVGKRKAFRVETKFIRRLSSRRSSKPISIDILLGDLPGRPPLQFEMRQRKFRGRANLIRWLPGRKI